MTTYFARALLPGTTTTVRTGGKLLVLTQVAVASQPIGSESGTSLEVKEEG